MSLNFGGSDQKQGGTQTIQMPAPSAAEQQLINNNLTLSQLQVQAMQRAEAQIAAENTPAYAQQQEIAQRANQAILDRLSGKAPVVSPEEQARIDQAYQYTGQQGMQDLSRYAQEQAAQRGMTTADSPIGAEALRQLQQFQTGLQSAKANSALNLGTSTANFNQNLRGFQEGLQQNAMNNRLALATAQPASYGLQNNLFAQRLAAAPRSMSGYGNNSQNGFGLSGGDFGQMLGGAGGFMRGYGSMSSGSNYGTPFSGDALTAQSYGYM